MENSDSLLGTKVQNYTLTRLIGEGGMATVYEAVHDIFESRRVAIKVLHPSLALRSNIKERFLNEAKLLASLDHKHIVKVIDFEQKNNLLAIIMELLEGQNLSAHVNNKGRLSALETRELFINILDAFTYAHSRGIVHRDVKPSNIFIQSDGCIKILDFGIAKLFTNQNDLTLTGAQIGTPAYMSPEQVESDKTLDHRSDIYSLGVMLYYLINGSLPYDTSNESIYKIHSKIINVPLPELSGLDFWNEIIQRSTQKDRNNRYQTCEEFKTAIINQTSDVSYSSSLKDDITLIDNQPRTFKRNDTSESHPTNNNQPDVHSEYKDKICLDPKFTGQISKNEQIFQTSKTKSPLPIKIIVLLTCFVLIGVIITAIGSSKKSFFNNSNNSYTLSSGTIKFLKNLAYTTDITVFSTQEIPYNFQESFDNVKILLTLFQKYSHNKIRITWLNHNDTYANFKAKALGIPKVQSDSVTQTSDNNFLGISVQYENKKGIISFDSNIKKMEYDLSMEISKVTQSSKPIIGFLTGDTSFSVNPTVNPILKSLEKTYKISIINPSDGEIIEKGLQTLIVSGIENISDQTLFGIDQFFMRGRKLIVLADAFKVNLTYGITVEKKESKVLNLLENYGIYVERNIVLDTSCGQVLIPQKIGKFEMVAPIAYPYFTRIGKNGFSSDIPAVSSLEDIILPWASSVTFSQNYERNNGNIKAEILAHATLKSVTVMDNIDLNPTQNWSDIFKTGYTKQPNNLIVYLNGSFNSYFADNNSYPAQVTSNTNAHLIVIGDEDFIHGKNATPENVTLLTNIIDWLSIDDNLITIRTNQQ